MRKKDAKNLYKCYRAVISFTLIAGGLSQLVAPVFAAGTVSGTSIINKATATYEDPTQPGKTINAESNTVTVTVAEVAGITNVGTAIKDSTTTTPVLPGDTITYDFLITNTGNSTTTIAIPTPVVTGPGALTGTVTYDVDADGNGTPEQSGVSIAAGAFPALVNSIKPGGSIKVHVPVLVSTLATSGSPLAVRLGDTGPNDNTAVTQDQPLSGTTENVATSGGTPVNGQREASAVQSINIATTVKSQAFATVLKTSTLTDPSNTPNSLNDDVISYSLTARVESNAPAGATGYTPDDLAPRSITVNSAATNAIIVSDVLPPATTLNTAPTAPAGWQVVYSADTTSTLDNVTDWNTSAAGFGGLSGVKRVGFIYTAGNLVKGTTVTGFTIQVKTSGLDANNGGSVYNIAQLLGKNPSDNAVVYDESGDKNPSNFNDAGAPGNQTPKTGVANQAADGVDFNNNNTGVDTTVDSTSGGEDNVVNVVKPGAVLNGPENAPAAIGPTDNNDDFTNKAATDIPANLDLSAYNPNAISFKNTVSNPATALPVTNVLLRPYTNSTTGAGASNVPVGTAVTIAYNGLSATYTYKAAGGEGFTPNNFILTAGTPVKIPSINPGQQVTYDVTINLPDNADAATAPKIALNTGYSVPISAFLDANDNSIPDATETQNRTIDRIYVGFLKLIKEVRILNTDGITVVKDYTQNPDAAFNAEVRPGRFLQYRVTYQNITEIGGTGSVPLNASKVVITEDGTTNTSTYPTAPNGNNWGEDYDGNGTIDTSNVAGSVADTKGGTFTFFSGDPGATAAVDQTGSTPATDVTKYVNTLPNTLNITPQDLGVFSFKRKIN